MRRCPDVQRVEGIRNKHRGLCLPTSYALLVCMDDFGNEAE